MLFTGKWGAIRFRQFDCGWLRVCVLFRSFRIPMLGDSRSFLKAPFDVGEVISEACGRNGLRPGPTYTPIRHPPLTLSA